MLEAQGGACAACRRVTDQNLHVDHCHTTGKVRGLLCVGCNTALGLLAEDSERIRGLLGYLEVAMAGLEPATFSL
ncbi:endonuclease VII domain-containing protein [Nonomuraea sp. NBC_00507]|uniref:endonuclease VII domain-containing protein n=1 Tax=Nonomuraea sp. NBC_00507 TaxID=2976002 RepID=UPI003FA5FC8C